MWGDTIERGDTRVKAIKSDSDSDSDEQKKVARFFRKKWRGDTLSYRPGCHPPSDATLDITNSNGLYRFTVRFHDLSVKILSLIQLWDSVSFPADANVSPDTPRHSPQRFVMQQAGFVTR